MEMKSKYVNIISRYFADVCLHRRGGGRRLFYLKIITVLHDDNGAEECLYFSIPSDAACCPDVGDVLCSLAVLSLLMGAHTSHCTGHPTVHSQQQPVRQHRAAHCPLNMNILSLLLLTWLGMASSFSRVARVQMIQRQSCYFTPYDKQLTCQCTNHQTVTFLGLKLMFFIKEKGQEVGILYLLLLNYLHSSC